MAVKPEIAIECLHDSQQFLNLKEAWDRLLEKSDVRSPFLTHGWHSSWLTTYGTQSKLVVFVARRAGEIVGIIPCVQRTRFGFKVLELTGTGKSDWLDLIIDPPFREGVLKELLSYLVTHRDCWHLINFRDMLSDSPSIAELEHLCRLLHLPLRKQVRTVSPYLLIDKGWNEYLGTKSAKFRSNIKYYRKKAIETGKTFSIKKLAEMDQRHQLLDAMGKVEAKSWKARAGTPKLTTRVGKEFYGKFSDYFSEMGCLEIWTASLGEQVIAFLLNIVYEDKCYHYNATYDEGFCDLSPGTLLHAEAIKAAFDRRLREYDFLSGDEPYKYKWCESRRDIYQMVIFRRTPVSFAAFLAVIRLRWFLKKYDIVIRMKQKLEHWKRRLVKQRSAARMDPDATT